LRAFVSRARAYRLFFAPPPPPLLLFIFSRSRSSTRDMDEEEDEEDEAEENVHDAAVACASAGWEGNTDVVRGEPPTTGEDENVG
jgi:hypothetical protein